VSLALHTFVGSFPGARYVLVSDLIEQLEREQYTLADPRFTVEDLAARRGWNQRATALIAELMTMLEGK
jgi:hypothetical protein